MGLPSGSCPLQENDGWFVPVPELATYIFSSQNLVLGVIPILKFANCTFDPDLVVPVSEFINYTVKSLNLRYAHLVSSHRHGSRRSQHNLRAPSK